MIRDFVPADFETLWRIDQTCFAAGIAYSRAELIHYIRGSSSFTLIAESSDRVITEARHSETYRLPADNRVAGFIVAEFEGDAGHIITIDVVAAVRGGGVGSLLLGSAEERLRARGCGHVELETAVDNLSALSFYKRHQYSVVGTSPRYYSNGVDALTLEKIFSGV